MSNTRKKRKRKNEGTTGPGMSKNQKKKDGENDKIEKKQMAKKMAGRKN